MTKITKIDRAAAKRISLALETASKPILEGLGLEFRRGGFGATYDAHGDKLTVRAEIGLADPAFREEAERKRFAETCHHFNLEPHHYGTRFEWNKKTVTLCGVELTRSRYPLKVRTEEGRYALLPETAAQRIKAAQA